MSSFNKGLRVGWCPWWGKNLQKKIKWQQAIGRRKDSCPKDRKKKKWIKSDKALYILKLIKFLLIIWVSCNIGLQYKENSLSGNFSYNVTAQSVVQPAAPGRCLEIPRYQASLQTSRTRISILSRLPDDSYIFKLGEQWPCTYPRFFTNSTLFRLCDLVVLSSPQEVWTVKTISHQFPCSSVNAFKSCSDKAGHQITHFQWIIWSKLLIGLLFHLVFQEIFMLNQKGRF